MKNKSKKILRYIIIVAVSILFVFGVYAAYENFFKKPVIPSVDELVKEKKKNDYKDKDENQPNIEVYQNILPGARDAYGNGEIMGKLDIPNLNISAWITRASNNEYYLDYNLYRQYDAIGAPFFDFRNTNLNTARQINIYGHNTTNEAIYDQLPFINLEAYLDAGIFNNYKDMYLSIDERQIHYEVIAVKIITDADNEHMKVNFKDENDFLTHSAKLLQNTTFRRENIGINKNDSLIVLQICHFNPPNTYLLVIGKEVKK